MGTNEIGTNASAAGNSIAVAVAHSLLHAEVTAIDISPQALDVARRNAQRNSISTIRFLEGDLLAPVSGECFDFILSNPPYVPLADRASLAVEVRRFEPELALFAGQDGLDIYKRLIPQAFPLLSPGGWLLLELGAGQSPALRTLLIASGFAEPEFLADLQGIPRVALARRA